MNSQEIAEIMKLYLAGLSAKEIGKELGYTTKTIASFLYDEIKEKPSEKQTVLKWIKFNKDDKTTHPTHEQEVLVSFFHGHAVCNFDKTYKKFVVSLAGNRSVIDKVHAWMPIFSPHFVDDVGITYIDAEINNEYLLEQTAIETFDIIDAITPALRDAVKHLLVQQGAHK